MCINVQPSKSNDNSLKKKILVKLYCLRSKYLSYDNVISIQKKVYRNQLGRR